MQQNGYKLPLSNGLVFMLHKSNHVDNNFKNLCSFETCSNMSGKDSSKRSFKQTKLQQDTEERIEENYQSQKNERKKLLQKKRSKQRLSFIFTFSVENSEKQKKK